MAEIDKISVNSVSYDIKDAAARYIAGVEYYPDSVFTSGYLNTKGTTVDTSSVGGTAGYIYCIIPCSPGDRFTITGKGGDSARLYAFAAASETSVHDVLLNSENTQAVVTDRLIVAPENAALLIVNFDTRNSLAHELYKGETIKQLADDFYGFRSECAVYPTGDTTARQTDIANALTQYGVCYLAPGDYYISNTLTLPDNAKLYGAGRATHVIYTSNATGQMIECGSGNQIANIWFDGGLTERPSSWQGLRHCILLEKGSESPSKNALQMHDCWVTGFSGVAVCVSKNGFGTLQSVQMTNCIIQYNGYGIQFLEKGEYGVVSNCSFLENYYGAAIAGGNNFMSNCLLSGNYIGAYVYGKAGDPETDIENNSHGSFVGCVFNHNDYRGIVFYKITAGYTVVGGYIGKSANCDVWSNSPFVHFSGTRFLSVVTDAKTFTLNDGASLSLTGCVFTGTPVYTMSAKSRINFSGCYRAALSAGGLTGELVPYKSDRYFSGDDIPVSAGVTLSAYRPTDAVITDTNKWSNTDTSGYQCLFLRIDPGSGVKITTKADVTSYYGIMTAFEEPADGEDAPLSTKTGYTGVFTKTGQETVTFTAPSDAKYLYVCTKYNGTDVSPDALVIDGIDLMTGYDLTRHGFIPANI